MSDDDSEDDDPAVELGEGPLVEGAPVARVASRLSWPIERSRLLEREGDAVVRTPDGPRELAAVLDDVDVTYFDTRRTFVESIREVVRDGPVAVVDDGDGGGGGDSDGDDKAPTANEEPLSGDPADEETPGVERATGETGDEPVADEGTVEEGSGDGTAAGDGKTDGA